jgi:glycogen debranching enzyme
MLRLVGPATQALIQTADFGAGAVAQDDDFALGVDCLGGADIRLAVFASRPAEGGL